MEEFKTSIFERTKEKARQRLLYNLAIIASIVCIWLLYYYLPFVVGLKVAIGISIAIVSFKLYDDRYMGISAYGVRKDTIIIAEEYLEVRGVRIPYTDLTNLVIYVEEYLGKPREFFGIHHGGNNLIEFEHNGRSVSINYVIKNKPDYDLVSRLVDGIEKDPRLKNHLRKL